MADKKMQRVEFEFPVEDDPIGNEIVVEPATNRTENVMDAYKQEEEKEVKEEKPAAKVVKEEDVEIEVIDDTPAADRGRKASDPADDVTDKELKNYSDEVKSRIKHLGKSYHDQRRIAEAAQRERDELAAFAKSIMKENETLKTTTTRSKNSLIQQAKLAANESLKNAQQQYREAFDSADSEKMVLAQTALSEAVAKKHKVDSWKPEALQRPSSDVQRTQQQGTPAPQRPAPAPAPAAADPKLTSWLDNNSWFGTNEEMSGFAYGAHATLLREGIDGNHPEYYKKLDTKMRQKFPEEFDSVPATKDKTDSVVAPVTRSSAPKRYKLTETQVAIAKKLGLPLAQYAEEAAKLEMGRR